MGSELYAYGLLAIPLFSATLIAFFFRRSGGIAAGVSIAAAALILATALHLIFKVDNFEYNASWIEIGSFSVDFGFLIDDLAKLMLFVVAFVGFLVHVFSYGYMKEDPDRGRFFGGLSIFMFSMLGLVIASGLVTLFIFWELVGFSSYMLIGFYLDKPSAAAASKKAFIVNRVGDFGFLIGIVMVFSHFGTFSLPWRRDAFGFRFDDRDWIAAVLRYGWKVGPIALARVASRRDGGTDAGFRLDPRGDDGSGWRIPVMPYWVFNDG